MEGNHLKEFVRTEFGDSTEAQGYSAGERLLSDPEDRPTAIFASNDYAALGAFSAAHDRGLSIPGDLSIVSIDNTFMANMRAVMLTSVDIRSERQGELAGDVLIDRLAVPESKRRFELAHPVLVVGETTVSPLA